MALFFRKHFTVLLLGAGLFLAISGWLYLLSRMVETERLAAEARIQEAKQLALEYTHDRFTERWTKAHSDAQDALTQSDSLQTAIPELLALNTFSSVHFDLPEETVIQNRLSKNELTEIRERIISGDLSPEAFLELYSTTSSITDGRDDITAMALFLRSKFPNDPALNDFIVSRALNFTDYPLSPAYRLFLLRRNTDETVDHSRLIKHLEIASLESTDGFEISQRLHDDVSISFYWSPEDLSRLIDNENSHYFVPEPVQDSIPLNELSTFPFLQLRGDTWTKDPVKNDLLLNSRFIAIVAGLLMLAVAITAILLSRRESKLANLKTELASSMAHEFRTPLAGQRMLLDSLQTNKDLTPAKREEYLRLISSENQRLSHLAEEFLTFSRLSKNNRLSLTLEAIEINEFAADVITSFQNQCVLKTDQFSHEIEADLPLLSADRALLSTALLNLLENAWKYSADEKRIQLKIIETDQRIQFCITDNGIGISAKHQKEIFQNFYRVNQLLTRERDGLGLGLSIVQRIAEAHDGIVSVSSTPNKGSTFTLSLPL